MDEEKPIVYDIIKDLNEDKKLIDVRKICNIALLYGIEKKETLKILKRFKLEGIIFQATETEIQLT